MRTLGSSVATTKTPLELVPTCIRLYKTAGNIVRIHIREDSANIKIGRAVQASRYRRSSRLNNGRKSTRLG